MGLIDSIRKAEEKARHAYERAAEISEDTQRRIRQKMRIYPRPAASATVSSDSEREPGQNPPEPIISVSGKDVPAEELGKKPTAGSRPEQTDRRRGPEAA